MKIGVFMCVVGLMTCVPVLAHADPCKAVPDRGPAPSYVAPGSVFVGPVTYVGDGDSLCVGVGRKPAELVEVRLADFYAAELHDAGGSKAKALLVQLAMGKRVRCPAQNKSYDRIVAVCTLNDVSLGTRLRELGSPEGGRGR